MTSAAGGVRDSLWQAHDPRYSADQVCVIPGTVAVAGITRVDEPVGELLDRFEKASVDALVAAGVAPQSLPRTPLGAGRRPRPRSTPCFGAPTSSGPAAWSPNPVAPAR